jgi:DNA-binding protein Fis
VIGSAQLAENEVLTQSTQTEMNDSVSLRSNVQKSLDNYFQQLNGETPANLYGMVISEVEKPLLDMVLKLTNGNQSKAAIVLGISRGTLRKKMAIYGIL